MIPLRVQVKKNFKQDYEPRYNSPDRSPEVSAGALLQREERDGVTWKTEAFAPSILNG
jgi:hypothetical protein